MKKVFLLIVVSLLFIPLTAQVEETPPKIILEIDKKVGEIDSITFNTNWVYGHDFWINGNDLISFSQIYVWVIENRIVKIKRQDVDRHSHLPSYDLFYFENGNVIKIIRSFRGIELETFYYDYNETVKNLQLRIVGKDTLFWDVEMLKLGYSLYDQNKDLQNFNPFDSLVYDNVVAYDFDGKDGREIVMDGKLVKDAKNPKTVTKEQVGLLIQTITDTAAYGYGSPGYFEQTIGIVFYNNKEIAAHISISFDANSLKSSIYLPATQYYFDIVAGDDYYTRYPIQGFSPGARKQLRKLFGELGLKNCPTKDGIWDGE